jgi:hypothetical protein
MAPSPEHPETDPDELVHEELELEDADLEEEVPPQGPEADFLRRVEEHEVVPLEEDADPAA